jgi:hypothetical protein
MAAKAIRDAGFVTRTRGYSRRVATYGGAEQVTLRSGAIRCGCSGRPGADHAIWVRRDPSGEEVRLPVPSGGSGGEELVVSLDERWAALFLYSGQSEVGWELFALDPLRHVGGTGGYLRGTGDAPRFSPDGNWLVMGIAVTPMVRGTSEYAEEALDGGAGEIVVDWGALYTQRVPSGPIVVTPIGTPIPRSLDPDVVAGWALYDALVVDDDRVVIQLGWATAETPLPASGPVTTRSP